MFVCLELDQLCDGVSDCVYNGQDESLELCLGSGMSENASGSGLEGQ